jgi:hypothetical protein
MTTPSGKRKQAAAVGTPVREEMTADPPVSNMAVTRMLVKRPNVMYTKWVAVPYRALTASKNV